MGLKKANALLGLLSAVCMFAHIGYNIFCYLTFFYNPTLTTVFSLPVIVVVCAHAILGMLTVFLSSDGTRLDLYPKQNRRIILKRVSAALIFPLLILHTKSFALMKQGAADGNTFLIVLLIIVEVLFFAVVITHISTSLTAGLVTLGLLTSIEKQVLIDRVVYVIGALMFIVSSCAISYGRITMFLVS